MTIAKEKTSAALLCVLFSLEISGAVHLVALLGPSDMLQTESLFLDTVAKPKSVMRA